MRTVQSIQSQLCHCTELITLWSSGVGITQSTSWWVRLPWYEMISWQCVSWKPHVLSYLIGETMPLWSDWSVLMENLATAIGYRILHSSGPSSSLSIFNHYQYYYLLLFIYIVVVLVFISLCYGDVMQLLSTCRYSSWYALNCFHICSEY